MKAIYLTATAVMGLLCAFIKPETPKPAKPTIPTQKPASGNAPIKRGEYLVAIMGCGDCHSPKKTDCSGARARYGPLSVRL